MFRSNVCPGPATRHGLIFRWMLVPLALAFGCPFVVTEAQAGNFDRQSAVGGVAITTDGILSNVTVESQQKLREFREKAAAQQAGELKPFVEMRKVSLRRLDEAIKAHRANQPVPLGEEITHLAGLQQVQYIFLFPDQKDIVLAGPAEGWKIDAKGNSVGLTTERPVLLLDDLMAALRSVRAAGQGGFSCSIDPSQEGLKNLQTVAAGFKTIGDPQQTSARLEEALGPQTISIHGIPASSHFARVMVAADYRMKRLAMNFETAPIRDLPSFLHLSQATGHGMSNMLPRWWLAPTADPLLADPDGLSWELRKIGVRCQTEEDFVAADGERKQSVNKGSETAKKWADTFSEHYDELAKKEAIFGQLRNLIELSVTAALIDRENMFERVGLAAPHLMSEELLDTYDAPKQVATQVSLLKKGKNWLISASGGVQMFPYALAGNRQQGDTLAPIRTKVAPANDNWWWD